MTEKKKKESFLELFKFKDFELHYFEELESSFWDSENIMNKKYKAKLENLKKDNSAEIDIKSLENAYKILLNSKMRGKYCKYLMYEYTLSQPINMNLLIEKYYSIIFPYYLFLLKSDKEDNKYIILDNINFSINFYEKNGLKNSFEVDSLEDIKIKTNENSIIIKVINTKNEIIIIPQVEEHLFLMYALIIFMSIIKKRKDNWKKDQSKVNEINQNLVKETIKTIYDNNKNMNQKINEFKLLILSNDSFIPKGIKYKTYVEDKNSSIQNKYLIIGNSYIYFFKDEEMKEILNIIPLMPGETMFEFYEKEKNIKISIGYKEYNLFFNEAESYNNILKVVMNILENDEDLFDQEDLDKVSQFLYNDKIMGGDLKNTPIFSKSEKDIAFLEIKLENLKKAKINAEEKGSIYKVLNFENNEKENKEEKKSENKSDGELKEENKEEGELNIIKEINENELNEIIKQEIKENEQNEIENIEQEIQENEQNKEEEFKQKEETKEVGENYNEGKSD